LGGTEGIDTVFLITLPKGSRHFLLIDDVITGSTLEACSRALLKKIPNSESIVCMAMAQS
jgi:predicted amidophosphoribosyltransferase